MRQGDTDATGPEAGAPVADTTERIDDIFEEMTAALPDGTPTGPIERARERVNEEVQELAAQAPRADGGVAAAQGASAELPVSMEHVFDRVDTSIFTLDADGNVVHWNQALQDLTGVSASEAR